MWSHRRGRRRPQGKNASSTACKSVREKAYCQELGGPGFLPHTEGAQEAAGSPLCGFYPCHKVGLCPACCLKPRAFGCGSLSAPRGIWTVTTEFRQSRDAMGGLTMHRTVQHSKYMAGWEAAHLVEYLPSSDKALGSIPSTPSIRHVAKWRQVD